MQKKLKVVFISSSQIPSYTANSIAVMHLCHELSKLLDLTVICVKNTEMLDIDYRDFYNVDDMRLILLPQWTLRCRGILFALISFCIVILNRPKLCFTRSVIWLNALFCALRIPNIFEIHNFDQIDRRADHRFKRNLKRIMNHSKLVRLICISESLKQECIDFGFKEDLITVLHSGVRISEEGHTITIPRKTNNTPVIAYFGSMKKGKGIPVFIEIAYKMPELKFWIIGGTSDQLPKCPPNLSHTPWQPPNQARRLLLQADIFLIPAEEQKYKFNSPLKLFDYMAIGKPIIASNHIFISEIIKDGVNGILVAPSDIEGFCVAIRRLVNDEELCKSLSENARKSVLQYSWRSRAVAISGLISHAKK